MTVRNKGFTLVELLVVISIIAILSAVGITVFGTATKNARDSQRMKDLQNISKALGMYSYYAHYYPTAADFNLAALSPLIYGVGENKKTFLDPVPEDSDPNRSYAYLAIPVACDNILTSCTGYAVCARKEGNGSYVISNCQDQICGDGEKCNMEVSSP